MTTNIYALVLAAGKGTRMPGKKPKVLQTLLGDTMLACVHKALSPFLNERIFTLVGYEKEQVQKELEHISPKAFAMSIEQKELLGTGHALLSAMPYFQDVNAEYILVVNGDVPLLPSECIESMLKLLEKEAHDIIFATIEVEDIAKYGRIIRNSKDKVQAIVEAKDYDTKIYGEPSGEINAGLYLFSKSFAEEFLPQIKNNNAGKEYYITDLIALAIEANRKVYAMNMGKEMRLLGANNPIELSWAEEYLRDKRNKDLLEKSVILHNPSSISIGQNVEIAAGVEIFPNCEFYGNTQISEYCVIESNCVLKNAKIGENTYIHSFSHIENANVAENCKIGPYARLRPQAELDKNVHVGNFVEIKKSYLAENVKANHLSYIGDAKIGARTNIGAGTITCNYDGVNKHLTSIGEDCFIGSNTALVAPIELADKVLVGAGSVLTKNVEENSLAITRAKQMSFKKK